MLESLGFSSVTFIVTIINIFILFLIFRKLLFKPVTNLMAERAKKIQAGIDQAEMDRVQAKKLLDRYTAQLKNAETEAEAIIKTAGETAEAEAARIIAGGKAQAEALIAAARRQLEAEQQAAFTEFKLEAAALVMAASARLVERELSGDDNRRYAAMLLDELSQRTALQKRNS